MVEQASESPATIYCISALPPASVMPATYLAKRIRARMPEAKLIVGLWHAGEGGERREQRLKRAQADAVYVTLEKAAAEIALLAELKTTTAAAPVVTEAKAA
jgi:hypothetical protein